MPAFLTFRTAWNVYWHAYKGPVQTIQHDTSVEYGEATGEVFIDGHHMGMEIRTGTETVWLHPRHVTPIPAYK